MDTQTRRTPKRKDDRIILQFDYDCFYAQVCEKMNPKIKSEPVGVRQKNILATSNYIARSRGVRKLMLVSEARKACPELVVVDGEDLTPFRDVSKILFNYFKSYSWNNKVERLGLDEVFMDVTDIVDYNVSCLNRNSMSQSFFFLSKTDPERGFTCDLTSIAGPVVSVSAPDKHADDPSHLRLLLGSHLAMYLRKKVESEFGYTSTCGVATNKLLSKMSGSKNKPRNQTTLVALDDEDVVNFMDGHTLRSVPGIGFRMASTLEAHFTGTKASENAHLFESTVTVGDVRSSPDTSAASLENLLARPGAERGVGARVWALLHGVDPTEVAETGSTPSQISIEDTYRGLTTIPQITEELHKLSCSLIRRMRVDLLDGGVDQKDQSAEGRKWLARPRTLRLSIRSWHQMQQDQSYGRTSRSGPLPSFVFDLGSDIEHIAERLVTQALIPLFRRLQGEKGQRLNLQLVNVCVANMVLGATEDRTGVGRDIGAMFRNQNEVLKPWKVVDESPVDNYAVGTEGNEEEDEAVSETDESSSGWESTESDPCPRCGAWIPSFSFQAHLRFHDMGGVQKTVPGLL